MSKMEITGIFIPMAGSRFTDEQRKAIVDEAAELCNDGPCGLTQRILEKIGERIYENVVDRERGPLTVRTYEGRDMQSGSVLGFSTDRSNEDLQSAPSGEVWWVPLVSRNDASYRMVSIQRLLRLECARTQELRNTIIKQADEIADLKRQREAERAAHRKDRAMITLLADKQCSFENGFGTPMPRYILNSEGDRVAGSPRGVWAAIEIACAAMQSADDHE